MVVNPRAALKGWALVKVGRDWKATCFFANKFQERIFRTRGNASSFILTRARNGIVFNNHHASGVETTTQFYDEV